MYSTEKSNHGNSLSLLFISFCSGFTSFHYQAIWSQCQFSYPGLKPLNFQLPFALFLLGCPVGFVLARRLLFQAGHMSLLLMFITFEVFFITFAVFSKITLCGAMHYKAAPSALRLSMASLLYIISIALLPVFTSTSIALLSRIFENADKSTLKSLYLYYLTGAGTSLFFSGILRLNLMGLENSIYLCAFLNFFCVVILLIHYNFTQDRK